MTDGGAKLARRQLLDLAEVSDGAVELLRESSTERGHVFTISLDTSGLKRGHGGIEVRPRERFDIVVSAGFPYDHPYVWAVHKRWAGTPHVQWGRFLCLYAAPSVEWNPSEGMRGLLDRLSEWVDRAAAGTLDPEGQPLHPPAVYSDPQAGIVLIHPDLGDLVPWEANGSDATPARIVAWCKVDGRRVDVLEWTDPLSAWHRANAPEGEVFRDGRPLIAVPVVVNPEEFGFEYPTDVKTLSQGLASAHYSLDDLLLDLARATAVNRKLRARQRIQDASRAGEPWNTSDDEDAPLFTAMLVGTPSRRIDGDTRLAHLAAWRLDSFAQEAADLFGQTLQLKANKLAGKVRQLAFEWFNTASISWMQVMEQRAEVTRRRDAGTPLSWLSGKRVLVLGCGALGAPVAEFCVRAGAAALTVADKGIVTPGILVRQPYADKDIGRPKALALAEGLSQIRADLDPRPVVANVRTKFFAQDSDLSDFDLVVDATADASVRSAVEKWRKDAARPPQLVTMVIGHDAQRGLVTTNLTHATGAGADAFRKVALHASTGAADWADIRDDFFPRTPRSQLFFPEPGCSAPTFVGSAAQTSALAGLMLNEALTVLERNALQAAPDSEGLWRSSSFASAVRIGAAASLRTSRLEWGSDTVEADKSSGFEVRVGAQALSEIRAEVRRGARVRGSKIETGGMLLGEFDDAAGIAYVDGVAGPPPDSYLAEFYFQHGVQGVQERVSAEIERSGGSTGFLGFWHTHPGGRAHPSRTDQQGMAVVVGPDGTTRRALMMILGGEESQWDLWRETANGQPNIYIRIVPRSETPLSPAYRGYVGGLDLQQMPPGSYFRGGFGGGGREAVAQPPAAVTDRDHELDDRRKWFGLLP